ncbi:c-type cytochrome, partial [Phascolarctobacterium faecium]|uniref:c-type cytochrome n=1 Tax=Phascolarctobacterium faecium TaxID=33025 RepID=UPI001D08B0FF
RRSLAVSLIFCAGFAPSKASAQQGDAGIGKVIYDRKCALCHGVNGDGTGAAAELVDPKPRDFTSGVYKIR